MNTPDAGAMAPIQDNPPDVTEAFRTLASVAMNDVPTITEQFFIEHILPMLSVPAGTKTDLSRWNDIAGTPLRGIDVVDNASGEHLFRLPPLLRALPTLAQTEVNYGNIIAEAELRTHVHPLQGDRYLSEQLSKARTGAPFLDIESAKVWNGIRARYGLPLLTLLGPDGQPLPQETDAVTSSGKIEFADSDDDDEGSFL